MNKSRKIIEKCLLVICCGIVCYILVNLYFLFLHPLLCTTVFPRPKAKTGADFYLSEEYKKLEYSEGFGDIVSSLDILKNGEIVDFYFRNNSLYDNPIHGNIPDPYVLDIQYEMQTYSEMKSRLLEIIEFNTYYDCYSIYTVPQENLPQFIDPQKKVVAIAFYEDEQILRCIMLPEDDKLNINNINGLTALDWGEEQDGRGSVA